MHSQHPQDDTYECLSNARAQELEDQAAADRLPAGFYFDKDRLMCCPEPKNDQEPVPIYICSKLRIIACTRDSTNQNHGRLLEFQDLDNIRHEWAMPMEMLASSGEEYRRVLLSMGLNIAPGSQARNCLTTYIQSSKPTARVRCVTTTGWHNDCFVLPEQTIGEDNKERIILQTTSSQFSDYAVVGTLQDWKQNIARLSVGNSRLIFSISTAFASPLLHRLGVESGGFHLRGASSTGKTTALHVAASVWGSRGYVQRWRATTNGIEALAAGHNDALLCLDELSQIHADDAGEMAYMLANGTGKARADRHGYTKKKALWRLLFLSTGEISLADHMSEAGKKARAGQEVRIIDIPADIHKYGLFEELHGHPNGAAFSQALVQACNVFHGVPAREFLRKLVEDGEGVDLLVEQAMTSIMALVPHNNDGQVLRVGKRFAIVAAAGELATIYGITGWKQGTALEAAKSGFADWLQARGSTGPQEETAILSQVRRFFELHGDSRFTPWDADEAYKTSHRAGFRRIGGDGQVSFFVFTQTFKAELAAGYDYKRVCQVCLRHGLLLSGSKGEYYRSEKLPFMGSTRCYKFTSTALGERDETQAGS